MGPYPLPLALAHAGAMAGIISVPYQQPSRRSQQPLAWIWPISRIGIGQQDTAFFNKNNEKAGSNAGLMAQGPPLEFQQCAVFVIFNRRDGRI